MWAELLSMVAQGAKGGGGSGGGTNGGSGTGGSSSGYGMANTSKSDGTAFASSPFDGSNWTVATGSARASATNTKADSDPASLGGIPTSVLMIAMAAIVAVKVLK